MSGAAWLLRLKKNGGERGIRTPGTLTRTTDFESAAIDHSAISPRQAEFYQGRGQYLGAATRSIITLTQAGLPEVARLKDAIAAADGLLLVTPDGADISRAVGCTSGCGRAWLHLASLVEERGDLPGYLLEFVDLAVGGDEVRE